MDLSWSNQYTLGIRGQTFCEVAVQISDDARFGVSGASPALGRSSLVSWAKCGYTSCIHQEPRDDGGPPRIGRLPLFTRRRPVGGVLFLGSRTSSNAALDECGPKSN